MATDIILQNAAHYCRSGCWLVQIVKDESASSKTFRASWRHIPIHLPLVSEIELNGRNQRTADAQDKWKEAAPFARLLDRERLHHQSQNIRPNARRRILHWRLGRHGRRASLWSGRSFEPHGDF
jgi:hypothetical protein